MNRILVCVVASVMMLGCQKREDTAAIKKAIDEMDKKFEEAVNAKDAEGAASVFWNSPELVVYYPDTLVLNGHDAVKAYWQTVFAMNEVKNFAFTERHVVATPRMASDWGLWTFTLQPKGAPSAMTFTGRFSDAWEQKNGKWVITIAHASSPIPSPPPPSTSQAVEQPKGMNKK